MTKPPALASSSAGSELLKPGRVHNIILDCQPAMPTKSVLPDRKSSADILHHLASQGYYLYSVKHDWDFWVEGMENLGHGIDQQTLVSSLLTPFEPGEQIVVNDQMTVFATLCSNLTELDVTQRELDYVKTLYLT